jgi:hypothetical protein
VNEPAERLSLVKRFYVWIEREYEVYAGSPSEAEAEAKQLDHNHPAMPNVYVEESPL